MDLKEWLHLNARSTMWLAIQMGATQTSVFAWQGGHRPPSPDAARKIMEITGGQVLPEDFDRAIAAKKRKLKKSVKSRQREMA